MKNICSTCGLEVNDSEIKRCPRCNNILHDIKKCEDCDGCSILKKKNNKKC